MKYILVFKYSVQYEILYLIMSVIIYLSLSIYVYHEHIAQLLYLVMILCYM